MSDQSEKRLTRREKRRVDRRDSIKRAAIEIFASKGYHGAKVSDIVENVGVAQGTFYLYYESKTQLFGELLDDFLAMVLETIADWDPASLNSRESLRSELFRVGNLLTEVLRQNRELTTIFFQEAPAVTTDFDVRLRRFYETLGTMLATFNSILAARGLIQSMNFRLLAFATIGQVERIIQEYVIHQTLEGISVPELVEHLVVLFMAGTTEPITKNFEE